MAKAGGILPAFAVSAPSSDQFSFQPRPSGRAKARKLDRSIHVKCQTSKHPRNLFILWIKQTAQTCRVKPANC